MDCKQNHGFMKYQGGGGTYVVRATDRAISLHLYMATSVSDNFLYGKAGFFIRYRIVIGIPASQIAKNRQIYHDIQIVILDPSIANFAWVMVKEGCCEDEYPWSRFMSFAFAGHNIRTKNLQDVDQ